MPCSSRGVRQWELEAPNERSTLTWLHALANRADDTQQLRRLHSDLFDQLFLFVRLGYLLDSA